MKELIKYEWLSFTLGIRNKFIYWIIGILEHFEDEFNPKEIRGENYLRNKLAFSELGLLLGIQRLGGWTMKEFQDERRKTFLESKFKK